jgi:hypothetical protein
LKNKVNYFVDFCQLPPAANMSFRILAELMAELMARFLWALNRAKTA